MVIGALQKAGGEEYLLKQSVTNPSGFMVLVGKVLPLQVTGANDGPVIVATGVLRAGELDDEKKE